MTQTIKQLQEEGRENIQRILVQGDAIIPVMFRKQILDSTDSLILRAYVLGLERAKEMLPEKADERICPSFGLFRIETYDEKTAWNLARSHMEEAIDYEIKQAGV